MPIGSIDVINNFPYQDIRDYYAKWYRPDLQGIVIVGDINVDEIEAKLKKVFADVKAPVNPAERIYYPVADNQEPLIYRYRQGSEESLCEHLLQTRRYTGFFEKHHCYCCSQLYGKHGYEYAEQPFERTPSNR